MMLWKNTVIKTLVYLFKKRRTYLSQKNHFLIVSTTGLGDTLWATPAIRALRQRYPNSIIDVLTSRLGKEVLTNNPHINELLVINDSLLSFITPFLRLRKKEIKTALLFHTSQRMAIPLCALCGIPEIIGVKGLNKGLDSLLTSALFQKREHEIEKRMRMIGAKGTPCLEIHWQNEDEEKVAAFLKGSTSPIVGLHPGAKDRFKQYPIDAFIKVGKELQKELGCQIIVTGSKSEKRLCEKTCSQIKGAIPCTGCLSVSALAALINRFSLFITNDTGPMHIAFAVNTPTLALFTPTDPELCGPYHANSAKVLRQMPTCTPCLRKKCNDPFCLLQIPVKQIVSSAKELYFEK